MAQNKTEWGAVKTSIVTTVILGALTGVGSYLSPKLWGWVTGVWDWGIGLLTHEFTLPAWSLGLIALSIPILISIYEMWTNRKEVTYTSYVEDIFDGVRWRWRYDLVGNVHKLVAHCGMCKLELGNEVDTYSLRIVGLRCED